MEQIASKNYADALFLLLCESGDETEIRQKTSDVLSQIEQLSEVFKDNPDFIKILSSPVIEKNKKHEMLKQTFEGKIEKELLNLMHVMTDNGRMSAFKDVGKDYKLLYQEKYGITEVIAVTAVKMKPAQITDLSNKLSAVTGKQIRVINRVDIEIIGGVLLQFESKQIDGTIKTKLDNIKQNIKNSIL